jgi:hypothetical protein
MGSTGGFTASCKKFFDGAAEPGLCAFLRGAVTAADLGKPFGQSGYRLPALNRERGGKRQEIAVSVYSSRT